MRRGLWLFVVAAGLGCGGGDEPVPPIDVPVPRRAVASNGPNAFGTYANVASRAEDRATVSLDVRDTPGNRRKAIAEMDGLLQELSSATNLPCTFLFQPVGPFEERPHHTGWLHLGRALVWRIEQCVEEGQWDAAAQWTVVATVFGLDLGGGSISDATLGYGVVDGARRALAPYVATLPQSSLRVLTEGTQRALRRLPDADVTIDNESTMMLTAVRALQDAHSAGETAEFAMKLYGDSREATKRFGKLKGNEQNAFVQSLIDEAQSMTEQLKQRALVGGAKRGQPELKTAGDAGIVAKQFLTAGAPWLSVRDLTVARTRLLCLTAAIHRQIDETGSAPQSIDEFDALLKSDPYTGISMGYLPLGQDFIVYSYGLDGKDDRGDTDSQRVSPDLRLEESAL
jgi:hypothetical protein